MGRSHGAAHAHALVSFLVCAAVAMPSLRVAAAAAATKRGLVGGTCGQTALFAPAARNWQYNYGVNRTIFQANPQTGGWNLSDPACAALAADPALEFVPMFSSLTALTADYHDVLQAGSARLLGLNEPSARKGEDAAAAAARWSEYEALAARSDPPLLLGSPAPGGLKLARGQQWLRDFFGNLSSSSGGGGGGGSGGGGGGGVRGGAHRVDFLAVHFYECDGSSEATAAAAAKAMMSFLDGAFASFGLPLWLTEFNCGDGDPADNPYANQSAANHLRFMRAALPLLEAAPHVAKYAWFQTFQKNTPQHPGHNPGCALTTHDGSALSELGEFYNSYSYNLE